MMQPYGPADLLDYLEHVLDQAGAPHLMTRQLKQTIAEHAACNIRLLNNMAGELLAEASRRQLTQLDESLYLELYSRPRN